MCNKFQGFALLVYLGWIHHIHRVHHNWVNYVNIHFVLNQTREGKQAEENDSIGLNLIDQKEGVVYLVRSKGSHGGGSSST